MIVAHIGLGKTATTTLQNYVFPELARLRPEIYYNDHKATRSLLKNTLFDLTASEKDSLKEYIYQKDLLISNESLVGWDPRFWEANADKHLEILGKHAYIVITLRETLPYLTSLYQQKVHTGHVRRPERFFKNAKQYDFVTQFSGNWGLRYFDVDSFDLKKLAQLYQERFNKVSIVPLMKIGDLNFLRNPFDLTQNELNHLRYILKSSPHSNRAYSKIGMDLTFKREKILNSIGARSFGPEDKDIFEFYRLLDFSSEDKKESPRFKKFKNLTRKEKIKQFPKRLSRRIFSWSSFIQNIVDKVLPYKSYNLPQSVYINEELAYANDRFVKQL